MSNGRTNELLGYSTNARLLIVNADDFGMYHAVNEAIFHTLKEGIVCSTSLMVPCPWAVHAMHLLRENPEIAFGVHLTMIRDLSDYTWDHYPLEKRKLFYSATKLFRNYGEANSLVVSVDASYTLGVVFCSTS